MCILARTSFTTLATAVVLVVGCGGNVIVDGNGGSGGDGGQGGVTLTTGTTSTSTGNTGGNTGSTASTGGTGGIGGGTGGNTGGTGGATTITSSTITTTSTVPSPCDNTGECGDGETGCLACALEGPCEESYFACVDSGSCIDFSNCFFECNGAPGCEEECSMSNPEGAQLYVALLDCAFCDACPNDCTGYGLGCF